MHTGRDGHGPPGGLFFFLDFDNFAAFVMTAVRTHAVRQAHLAAVAACYQVDAFQGIMRAAAVTPSG